MDQVGKTGESDGGDQDSGQEGPPARKVEVLAPSVTPGQKGAGQDEPATIPVAPAKDGHKVNGVQLQEEHEQPMRDAGIGRQVEQPSIDGVPNGHPQAIGGGKSTAVMADAAKPKDPLSEVTCAGSMERTAVAESQPEKEDTIPERLSRDKTQATPTSAVSDGTTAAPRENGQSDIESRHTVADSRSKTETVPERLTSEEKRIAPTSAVIDGATTVRHDNGRSDVEHKVAVAESRSEEEPPVEPVSVAQGGATATLHKNGQSDVESKAKAKKDETVPEKPSDEKMAPTSPMLGGATTIPCEKGQSVVDSRAAAEGKSVKEQTPLERPTAEKMPVTPTSIVQGGTTADLHEKGQLDTGAVPKVPSLTVSPDVDRPKQRGDADVRELARPPSGSDLVSDDGTHEEAVTPVPVAIDRSEDPKAKPSPKGDIDAKLDLVQEIPLDGVTGEKLPSAQSVPGGPTGNGADGHKDEKDGEKFPSDQAGQPTEGPDIGRSEEVLVKGELMDKSESGKVADVFDLRPSSGAALESLVDSGYKSPDGLGDPKKEVGPKDVEDLLKMEAGGPELLLDEVAIAARVEVLEPLRAPAEVVKKGQPDERQVLPPLTTKEKTADVEELGPKVTEVQGTAGLPQELPSTFGDADQERVLVNGICSEAVAMATGDERQAPLQEAKSETREMRKEPATTGDEVGPVAEAKGQEPAVQSHKDGDHDSGVDESTEGKDAMEELPKKPESLTKSSPAAVTKGAPVASSPAKKAVSPSGVTASPAKSAKGPSAVPSKVSTPPVVEKKLPMNKIVVGTSPSPNLKVVKSKIGSFENVKHKAGGGLVKVETKKIDLSNVKSRVGSTDNIQHKPSGGEKKITSRKLDWKAQSKVGSMDNATHKPGGGTKKIEVQKLDFKDKAKPKVGSKDNIQHKPGGGEVKIEEHKLEFKDKAKSKVGSMDQVSYKPGGGNVQIFDEKLYYKQQQDSSKKSSLTNSDEHISAQTTSPHGTTPQPVSPAPAIAESPSPQINGSQTTDPASPVAAKETEGQSKTPEVVAEAAKEVPKSAEILATTTSNGTSVEPAAAAVGTSQQ